MGLFKPKYITHYYQLFDNSKDDYGNLRDRREEVEDGALTFRRNGIVVLGEMGGFGFTRAICNVEFGGGYVANRSRKDQILVIKSPTGEVYRFRYLTRDCNWYRLIVVERAPSRYSFLLHFMREDLSDYGPLIGPIVGIVRVAYALVSIFLCWTITIGVLGALFLGSGLAVSHYLGHFGPDIERLLVAVVWTVEGVILGILILGDLAMAKGTWFYRLVLPLLFICLVGWLTTSGLILDTVATLQDMRPASLGK